MNIFNAVITFFKKNKIFLALLLLCAMVAAASPDFRSAGNFLIILRQTSINFVIAMGMTFVILTGGIDLSVGSILAFSSAVSMFLVANGIPDIAAITTALAIGAACGFLNGFLISYGKLQPFITTLVSMTVFRGLTLVFTGGRPINAGELPALFKYIGNGYLAFIPFPIVLMLVLFGLTWYALNHTALGRHLYAIGGNEEASRLAGINVDKTKTLVYVFSGLLASIAGIIVTSRLASAQPTAGTGYEMDAIAAAVVGGTSLAGGAGTMQGTFAGALIIGVLGNALNLLKVSSYYQTIAKGLVILFAVLLDQPAIKRLLSFNKVNKA
ncbi:MAG: ribose ABC transporter permease [Spirochaetaceae bacterium]|jgi:ribose transport system permease protein|nr:ribose ABC transporter permease [Spirochaetaceae bacterium]